MIRLIMRGNYSMEGPTWQTVTSETKDLIKKLLVVNPKDRLTIEQALQHEVFHAQRFTRQDGELLCIVHEDVDEENAQDTQNETKEIGNVKLLSICFSFCTLGGAAKLIVYKQSSLRSQFAKKPNFYRFSTSILHERCSLRLQNSNFHGFCPSIFSKCSSLRSQKI